MQKSIRPSTVSGAIRAPASKSYMQRAVAAALLSDGCTDLLNPSLCDDARAAMRVAQALGASVCAGTNCVSIAGGFSPKQSVLNCGEAGLCIRMFTPIAALHDQDITLTGVGSLTSRPLTMLEEPLRQLGAQCETAETGGAPIRVCGPLQGGVATVDGRISSQMLTGLLTALPCAPNDSTLHVLGLKSTPYIDITIDVLRHFGIHVEREGYERFHIPGGQAYRSPGTYEIEGDWSGASFHVVAGAIAGDIAIAGLNPVSPQADRAILDAVHLAGARTRTDGTSLHVTRADLRAFEFDAAECPDLFPPLVALAAYCKGTSTLHGASRLKHKESDRATVLREQFGRVGIRVETGDDVMLVHGGKVQGGVVDGCGDHRIAMAAAVAALGATGTVAIDGAECIAKSYSEFYDDLAALCSGGKAD